MVVTDLNKIDKMIEEIIFSDTAAVLNVQSQFLTQKLGVLPLETKKITFALPVGFTYFLRKINISFEGSDDASLIQAELFASGSTSMEDPADIVNLIPRINNTSLKYKTMSADFDRAYQSGESISIKFTNLSDSVSISNARIVLFGHLVRDEGEVLE